MTKTASAPKRNVRFIKQWIAALRSGKYRQTAYKLRRERPQDAALDYCCLGVACDLTTRSRVKGLPTRGWKGDGFVFGTKKPATCTLPTKLREFIGLTRGEQNRLIAMNDAGEASFAEIADSLEGLLAGRAL